MQDEALFQPLLDLLEKEPETKEAYEAFENKAHAALGDNWEEKLRNHLASMDRKKAARLEEKLENLLNYKGAVLAWNEAYTYLNNVQETPLKQVEERLPTLEYWLGFFGEDGVRLLNELKEAFDLAAQSEVLDFDIREQREQADKEKLLNSLESSYEKEEEEIVKTRVVPEETLTREEEKKLWEINNFAEQKSFYNQVTAWINARCIHLGNIEKTNYPYYGITVDILKEALATLDSLLSDKNYYDFIETHSKETLLSLRNFKESALKELDLQKENGFEPVLSLEEKEILKAKELLGEIDRSKTKEYLGPAPDGFVALDDPFEIKSENSPKEKTEQGSMVQSGQRPPHPSQTGRPAQSTAQGQRPTVSGVRPAQPAVRPQQPQIVRQTGGPFQQTAGTASRPAGQQTSGTGTIRQGQMQSGRPASPSYNGTTNTPSSSPRPMERGQQQRPYPSNPQQTQRQPSGQGTGHTPQRPSSMPVRPSQPTNTMREGTYTGQIPSQPQGGQISERRSAPAAPPNIPNLREEGSTVPIPAPPVLPDNPDDKK